MSDIYARLRNLEKEIIDVVEEANRLGVEQHFIETLKRVNRDLDEKYDEWYDSGCSYEWKSSNC